MQMTELNYLILGLSISIVVTGVTVMSAIMIFSGIKTILCSREKMELGDDQFEFDDLDDDSEQDKLDDQSNQEDSDYEETLLNMLF